MLFMVILHFMSTEFQSLPFYLIKFNQLILGIPNNNGWRPCLPSSSLSERCSASINSFFFILICLTEYQLNIIFQYISHQMVQVQKSEKKAVYRYLLQEGVIVIHKDFTTQPHKGTNVPNIHVRLLLRSLKDRGNVELVFSWQYFYYFINEQGKKYLSDYLNLTEEVVPLTWKKDEKRQYEHIIEDKGRKIRRDRDTKDRPEGERRGGRGGPRVPRERREQQPNVETQKPAETTTA